MKSFRVSFWARVPQVRQPWTVAANDTADYVLTYLANNSKVRRITYHKDEGCVLRRCQYHADVYYKQRIEELSNKISTARISVSLKGRTEAMEKIDTFTCWQVTFDVSLAPGRENFAIHVL